MAQTTKPASIPLPANDHPNGPTAIIPLYPPASSEPAIGEDILERGVPGKPNRVIKDITNPRLLAYLPDKPDADRPACIICPGGGYSYLAIDHEGHEVARMLSQHGVAAFVLLYRLPDGSPPTGVPVPIADVHRAIRLLRSRAQKFNIDPARIGIMGFSAGGHVASTAATQFDGGNVSDPDPVNRESSRPDFAILIYPVVSMHDPIAHVGSRHNLLGLHATEAAMDQFSADQTLTKQTPPLFVVHAEDDKTVPVQNSLNLATAAAKAGVSCELNLYKVGGHGFGMGAKGSEASAWPAACIQWLHAGKILAAD